MAAIRVELRLDAPTCIAQRPTAPGQMVTTQGYLSGAALRGAIAARWLAGRKPDELDGEEGRAFELVFQKGAVRFGPGWPMPPETGETWIVPKSAWTAKRDGGWKSDWNAGVHDALPHLLADTAKDHELLDDLDPFGGEFAWRDGASGPVGGLEVRRRLIMRSAIGPGRGVAADGQLYAFEAIESKQPFVATLTGPDDALEELQKRAIVAGATLTLGSRRSAGDGAASMTWVEAVPAVERDVATLIGQARAFSGRAEAKDGQVYLPVTLESDLILRDEYLLPCTSGDPRDTLRRYFPEDPPPGDMRLVTAIQSTRWVGGWDMVRSLPRPPQLAVEHGSVWVYRVPEADLEAAIGWWLRAERDGLGEGLGQGLGGVRLLHPFHAESRKVW